MAATTASDGARNTRQHRGYSFTSVTLTGTHTATVVYRCTGGTTADQPWTTVDLQFYNAVMYKD